MAVLISINKSKKKYRLWTTVADGWLTDWITREEAVKELQQRAKDRCKEECKKIANEFPLYYSDKNYKRILELPFN